MQQSSQHVLCLSRPTQEKSHGGYQQLHLDSQRSLASHSIDEHFQSVGGSGNSLPIHTQQPEQSLPALVKEAVEYLDLSLVNRSGFTVVQYNYQEMLGSIITQCQACFYLLKRQFYSKVQF